MVDATQISSALALPTRLIGVERPWAWLAQGWADLWRAPAVGLVIGALDSSETSSQETFFHGPSR